MNEKLLTHDPVRGECFACGCQWPCDVLWARLGEHLAKIDGTDAK